MCDPVQHRIAFDLYLYRLKVKAARAKLQPITPANFTANFIDIAASLC